MARDLNVGKMDFGQEGLNCVLNELETKMMGYLWNNESATAREMYEKLRLREFANTTIVVTLDRMHKKGLVDREVAKGRGGLHYIYKPRFTKQALGERLSLMFAENMLTTFGDGAAAFFSDEAMKKLMDRKKK